MPTDNIIHLVLFKKERVNCEMSHVLSKSSIFDYNNILSASLFNTIFIKKVFVFKLTFALLAGNAAYESIFLLLQSPKARMRPEYYITNCDRQCQG